MQGLASFYHASLNNFTLPKITWKNEVLVNGATLTINTSQKPVSVKLWVGNFSKL
jgi:hypothetical protein